MAGKETPPKFKLAERDDQSPSPEGHSVDSIKEEPKQPLTLRKADAAEPIEHTPAARIEIEDILEEAYAPDHERLKRAKRLSRINSISMVVGLFALSAFLTYAYAHILKQWPTLEPTNWYLPFIISVALSVAALIKAYQFFTKKHSISLMLTGLCIAGGLTSWNMTILHVASQTSSNALALGAWEPKDMTESLILNELNVCRGISSNAYTSASVSDYESMFHDMPRNQWKPYFQLYLSPSEFENINSINLDKNMHIVAGRMQAKRSQQWTELQALYESPTFFFMLKQWGLSPYTKVLQSL